MDFKLADLIDLEAARIANAEFEQEEKEELEKVLQARSDLPGQSNLFDK